MEENKKELINTEHQDNRVDNFKSQYNRRQRKEIVDDIKYKIKNRLLIEIDVYIPRLLKEQFTLHENRVIDDLVARCVVVGENEKTKYYLKKNEAKGYRDVIKILTEKYKSTK